MKNYLISLLILSLFTNSAFCSWRVNLLEHISPAKGATKEPPHESVFYTNVEWGGDASGV